MQLTTQSRSGSSGNVFGKFSRNWIKVSTVSCFFRSTCVSLPLNIRLNLREYQKRNHRYNVSKHVYFSFNLRPCVSFYDGFGLKRLENLYEKVAGLVFLLLYPTNSVNFLISTILDLIGSRVGKKDFGCILSISGALTAC